MNRIYRIVWSRTRQAWVVASELARARRKGGCASRSADEATPVRVRAVSRTLLRLWNAGNTYTGITDVGGGAKKLLCSASIAALSLGVVLPAHAEDRHWDANGTALGHGGTGTWNTTNSTWSQNTDGVSGPYGPWNNAALDNAIFGGTAGTVTLGAPITVHNIIFNVHNYTLTGGTLTLGGTTPTIGGAGNATINSVIAGTAGLTKVGAGTLTLTANNSFTGGVTVDAGTLTLSGTNTFTGTIDVNAGTLAAASNASLGNSANVVDLADGATLRSTGLLTGRVVNLTSGQGRVLSGAGAAHFTGSGGISAVSCGSCGVFIELSDITNDFTGQVTLTSNNSTGVSFRSVRDVGQSSALGAGGAISLNGSQASSYFNYTGSGDSSNRDWQMTTVDGAPTVILRNSGSGTLTLTGNISATGNMTAAFLASSADLQLLGVLSGANNGFRFIGSGTSAITLGPDNTFTAGATVEGGVVSVGKLADGGASSSLGAGTSIAVTSSGTLSYTGGVASSNRTLSFNNGTLSNDGSGALTLSGDASLAGNLTLGGSYTGADNTLSGIISGAGDLVSSGPATWVLSGANTRTGAITVNGGTLRAGSASAFGATTGITTTGGTLDLSGFNMSTTSIGGTGGIIATGGANLALTLGAGASNTYGGSIAGTGSLTKLGAGTLTLTGANTYTGATTIDGGTLTLDFSPAGGATSDIISASSTVNMGGGTLNIVGAGGEANSQTFNGLNITGGGNTIDGSIVGASLDVSFGAINRTAGLANFILPGSGSFTTTNGDGALGGWATINGSDYAKVLGGQIVAFTAADYVNKDDASTWLVNEILSDAGGAADTPFQGTVSSSVQIGGLQYTAAANSVVTVDGGNTLGVDGTIIVAPSVGSFNQTITGGSLTGPAGGGSLGVQQNGAGTFTIESEIADNTGAVGFTKSGTGNVALSGANTYTGATTVSRGTLSIDSVADAGMASAIGAASADSSNLVLQAATLDYTGATASSDRGFTFTTNGAVTTNTINVSQIGANVTFGGLVTSPDNASLIKTGPGTLTLSNAGNDYIGTTTVSGGTLSVGTLANGGLASGIGASSSASSSLVLQSGGELEYTGGTTGVDRGFTLGTGGGAIDVFEGATTLTVSGTATGAGSLTKNGAGTLILSGVNTYTGGSIVDDGILRAGSTQAFGTGLMTVNPGAVLDLNGFNNTATALAGDGNVTLGSATITLNGASGAFTGTISGTGGVTKSGGGTQTMTGCNNDYTGATTINGTLSVDCLANGGLASGIGASDSASANLTLIGGRLTYTGASVSIDRGFTLQSSNNFINVDNGAATLEFEGAIAGGGTLQKEGAGVLLLSGANTYTGHTVARAGVLRADSATAFGSTASLQTLNVAGAMIDLNGFDAAAGYIHGGGALGGEISLGSATLTITAGNNGSNFAGVISGSGGIIKNGATTHLQTITGCNNSYGGSTVINGGILAVSCLDDGGTNSSIGASGSAESNLVLSGGTLRYVGAGGSTNRLFTLGASANSKIEANGSGALSFTNTDPIAFSSSNTAQTIRLGGTNTGANSFALQITDNGTGLTSFTKEDGGTWVLTNPASTYTGVTTISGGILGVDKLSNGGIASSIGASATDASNLVIGNDSTLRYTGSGDSTDRLFTLSSGITYIQSTGSGAIAFNGNGVAGGGGTRVVVLGGTNTGANLMGVSITNGTSGTTTLAKNDSGTWHLTGANTYSGLTNVNAGTLILGNGGATGSIASGFANVAGGALLGFNRSDAYTYAGTIQGAGSIEQLGGGLTILTGANTYTGATTVSAGSLWINGDQSAATGLTSVAAGATLGGVGVIGGDVSIANGGILAPGNSPGVLTIAGDLILDSASILDFEFGQANVVGGPLNDLIEVGGNLTLDGVIDVTVTAGGSFDAGLYRVINYAGTLTDNILDPGTMPPGSDVFVQTSIANQVNLVNTAGLDVNLWDGDAGPKFDGTVNGGDGLWQNGGGNDNWADISGIVNLPWIDDAFAIFTATAGTVTVDDSLGPVTASGMQFASDGYLVTGDPVGIVGPQSILRVGDGTAAGLSMTATIASELTGATEVVKTDLGTLVLGGVNTYTGGTRIEAGVLSVSGDANLGDAAGDVTFDGGALQSTATFASARNVALDGAGRFLTDGGTTLTLSGLVSGAGALEKDGAGTLVFAADTTYAGGTVISAGTLQLGDGGTSGSILGDVVNDGLLAFNRSDALTFGGTISGAGALSQIGAGTTVFTADNTYTGGTTIASGALQLGDGGTSGSILGDVVNDSLLIFNRSDEITFAGMISGAGALNQFGAGTTILTADNSYAGATNVDAGTLLIDGDQSAATGLTSVASGAALGGDGTIGGDVTIANGGVLAPGSSDVGMLTINGVLSLNNTSLLDYEFGHSGVVGGPLNDLIEVGGDLTLDGVIDVTVSPGGVFDAGFYRVISYGGALIDNTLDLGAMPPGSDVFVQTAVANQVNLVNTAGLDLNFWDGAAGPKFDNTINGGDGIWQASGDDNWADLTGGINASYQDGAFVIFSADAGTVTVDDGLGAVNAAGMQFASDGYVITGDSVGLTGTQSIIRVGDGTAADLGMTATIEAALTGSSQLVKTDLGTLILAGANAYTGETIVDTGTLLVNGDNSAATGLTTVNAGTLGGVGVIGGDVVVAGGAIAPGSNGVGTLTIEGNLSLDAASTLNVEFGEANVIGGALNDLIEVGGDLLLDGTINVTEPAGGAFDIGVYRVFNYAGALTDNGLEIGSMPGGSSVFVQTAVAKQINLINAGGLTLSFWDGDSGPKFNGVVDGGDGVWQNSSGNDNWTSDDGVFNAPYADGTFAIFAGAPGVVAVDNSLGDVIASGMQFTVDGYTIEGGGLSLVGAPSVIRVGDGTVAGADMAATIRSVLSGTSTLEKTDLGTLVLTGENTYTGGTTISAGTLQLGDGGASGSIVGDVLMNGTLALNRSDLYTFDGAISGSGTLEHMGTGTTVLTGAHTHTGGTMVSAGTLQVDGSLLNTTVAAGATLSGTGSVGSVTTLAGSFVSPGNAATPFGTLTLTGDYTGSGTVVINTVLGDQTSATSLLAIEGSTTGATSPVLVNNAGGNGAQTSGDGIGIIEVDGASPADSFHLADPVQAGAYEYLLYQGGESDANDWFLRSELADPVGSIDPPAPMPSWRPGVAGYVLGPQASLEYGFTALGHLRSRVGDQGRVSDPQAGPPADAWMRAYTHDLDIAGERFEAQDLRMTTVQFGTDLLRIDAGSGSAHFGVMASVGESSATFVDPERAIAGLDTLAGEVEMDVAGGGLYWTRYGASGAYLDVSAQLLNYRNRYRDRYSAVGRQDGWGGTVAAEVGAPLALGATKWHVEPQLQIAWQRLELDGFTDEVSVVSEVSEDGLRGRAGLQLFRAPSDWLGMSAASPYLAVGVQRDFRDVGGVTVGATALREDVPDTTADLSAGFTGSIREGVELHFDLRYQHATEGEMDGVRGNFGFRVRF